MIGTPLRLLVLASVAVAACNNDTEPSVTLYSTVSNEALRAIEPSEYRRFKGAEIGDALVFHSPRKIGEAVVLGDEVVHYLDPDSHELLRTRRKWRDGLPERLPAVISADTAMAAIDGTPLRAKLYYLNPGSPVFPIYPTPKNPCWVVSGETAEGVRTLTVVDAVSGEVLGQGAPPPAGFFPKFAYALTGSWTWTCPNSGAWTTWRDNAAWWFNKFGYETTSHTWPTVAEVGNQLPGNTFFYELAHGGSTRFLSRCNNTVTPQAIRGWLSQKIPFSFIGSCDGMCQTGSGSLSDALRRSSTQRTVTVGYCGMSEDRCDACWTDGAFDWQDELFQQMDNGMTARVAFDRANQAEPVCALNNCMRFAGDDTFDPITGETRPPYCCDKYGCGDCCCDKYGCHRCYCDKYGCR